MGIVNYCAPKELIEFDSVLPPFWCFSPEHVQFPLLLKLFPCS